MKARMGIAIGAVLVAAGLVVSLSTAWAQPNLTGIQEIAALVKKGDMAAAKKAAEAYAKKSNDMEELMTAFKPANKKGIGLAGTDIGIQAALNGGSGCPTAAKMKKLGSAYEEMGYNIAAVGLIAEVLAPKADMGKKTRKDWIQWSAGLVESGKTLAQAGKAESGADLKSASKKVNNNCNSCHAVFN